MISKAVSDDLEGIYKVETTCFDHDILSRRSIKYMLNHKHNFILVAKKNSVICGYILTFCNPNHQLARHYSLAVLPEYRGESIARKLLLCAEQQIIGKKGIKLEIREDNYLAKNLYESMGYVQKRKKENYYQDGATAIEMVKYYI